MASPPWASLSSFVKWKENRLSCLLPVLLRFRKLWQGKSAQGQTISGAEHPGDDKTPGHLAQTLLLSQFSHNPAPSPYGAPVPLALQASPFLLWWPFSDLASWIILEGDTSQFPLRATPLGLGQSLGGC